VTNSDDSRADEAHSNEARPIDVHAVLEDPDFIELVRSKNRISFWLCAATMLTFYGFVSLLAWNSDFLAQKWSGSINRGIPLGIGVIIVSWILTGVYVRWANARYDSLVARVKSKMGSTQ
jgi:uncharacterized membrane protein (DUF485 family)